MPKPNDWHPIAPFAAARARTSADITITWSVANLQDLRPDWTKEQCEAFMRRMARPFATEMLRMGLTALLEMTRPAARDTAKSGQNDTDEDFGKFLKEDL